MRSAGADAVGGLAMSGGLHLAITGASGFIGRHTVAAALSRGHQVTAILRDKSRASPTWRDNPDVKIVDIDLSADDTAERLSTSLLGVDAVIHAAAVMSGDDSHHEQNTLKPLRSVLQAVVNRPEGSPRFVLVSSITVYDAGAIPHGRPLDEKSPIVTDPQARDAYCRSKLAQEEIALAAAAASNLELRIMRPGAVFGPGHLWNGHIGQALGPLVIQLERRGQVPVSFVGHCAEALVLAAERAVQHDDRAGGRSMARNEIINVLDDDLPDRDRYMAALRLSGWPRYVLPGSWRPLAAAASAVSRLGPAVSGRMPGLLRPAIICSRMKPIAYSNARLHERLGWQPSLTFEEAMAQSVGGSSEEDAYARAG